MNPFIQIALDLQSQGKSVVVETVDGSKIRGKVSFAGENKTFGFEQITINRRPIRLNEIKSVTEFLDQTLFKTN